MLSPQITMIVTAAVLGVVLIITLLTAGILPAIVITVLTGLIGWVLSMYGFLKVDLAKGEIDFYETPPVAKPTASIIPDASTAMPLALKEVFYIAGNDYMYDDAAAVCAAYDAELASYDQVNDAFSSGAEWCGYGWSQGGMALFPTQESTWNQLQQESSEEKRTACGRPGVNGGYFDPRMKFGVNCYGPKPKNLGGIRLPMPIPGTDSANFNKLVNMFKSMKDKMLVNPFNRSTWSEYGLPKESLPKINK